VNGLDFPVANQMYGFLWSVFGGLVIGFVFDLFRLLRKCRRFSEVMVYFQDLVFWLLVTLIMFAAVYFGNSGQLRWYLFLGALLGVLFYMLALSKIFMAVFIAFVRFIINILAFIYKIIYTPVIFTYNILKGTVCFLIYFIKKVCYFIIITAGKVFAQFKNIKKK
jgi:spore cortex biosynthesis protein YabQ